MGGIKDQRQRLRGHGAAVQGRRAVGACSSSFKKSRRGEAWPPQQTAADRGQKKRKRKKKKKQGQHWPKAARKDLWLSLFYFILPVQRVFQLVTGLLSWSQGPSAGYRSLLCWQQGFFKLQVSYHESTVH